MNQFQTRTGKTPNWRVSVIRIALLAAGLGLTAEAQVTVQVVGRTPTQALLSYTATGSCTRNNDLCGGLNQPCCRNRGGLGADRFCTAPGTTCGGDTCVACGGIGQLCCADTSCKTGNCQRDGLRLVCH